MTTKIEHAETLRKTALKQLQAALANLNAAGKLDIGDDDTRSATRAAELAIVKLKKSVR